MNTLTFSRYHVTDDSRMGLFITRLHHAHGLRASPAHLSTASGGAMAAMLTMLSLPSAMICVAKTSRLAKIKKSELPTAPACRCATTFPAARCRMLEMFVLSRMNIDSKLYRYMQRLNVMISPAGQKALASLHSSTQLRSKSQVTRSTCIRHRQVGCIQVFLNVWL